MWAGGGREKVSPLACGAFKSRVLCSLSYVDYLILQSLRLLFIGFSFSISPSLGSFYSSGQEYRVLNRTDGHLGSTMQPEFPQVLDSFILIPDTSFQDSSETLPAFVVALEGSEV